MSIIQLAQKPGAGPKKYPQKIGDESRKYPIYFFIIIFAANFMRDMSHVSKHDDVCCTCKSIDSMV